MAFAKGDVVLRSCDGACACVCVWRKILVLLQNGHRLEWAKGDRTAGEQG